MSEELNDPLTENIIRCIVRVHRELGPGFLEGVYRKALLVELQRVGLSVETVKEIPVFYRAHEAGRHRLELLVEGKVVVELKTVEELSRAHYAQLRSYLKAARLQVGLLVNFSKAVSDFRRVE
jgi:GxxExxY protein